LPAFGETWRAKGRYFTRSRAPREHRPPVKILLRALTLRRRLPVVGHAARVQKATPRKHVPWRCFVDVGER
jgi:hypothetical protein